MHYKEFPPHPALRAYVACLWASASGGPAQGGRTASHRVLPDNCIDILWQDTGEPAFAVGMMTRAIHVASERVVRTVAVRFKPGAAGIFLSQAHGPALPLHHLADRRNDLDQLWGCSDADRLADSLWSRELSDIRRLALIERSLLLRLQAAAAGADAAAGMVHRARPAAAGPGTLLPAATPAGRLTDPLIGAALDAIDRSGGGLRIETLADGLGVSRQHLSAHFRAKVGLTPKMYARICRFRRATDSLAQQQPHATDWARLAQDCGYFDQSHLIHDFQEFSGSTPESFLR